jgi:hypothetical protein
VRRNLLSLVTGRAPKPRLYQRVPADRTVRTTAVSELITLPATFIAYSSRSLVAEYIGGRFNAA